MKKYLITTLALSLVFSTPLLAEAVPSGDDGYASQTVSNDSITIDGNLNDWSTLNSFGYDSDTLQDEVHRHRVRLVMAVRDSCYKCLSRD